MEEKKRFLKGFLCGLGVTFLCAAMALLVYREASKGNTFLKQDATGTTEASENVPKSALGDNNDQIIKKIEEIEGLVDEYYLNEVDAAKVETQIYRGLMSGLEDPYAAYYTEEELLKMEESTSGEYEGIGASLIQNRSTGLVTVVRCYEGTPSAEAGMLPGDIIYKVGDTEVAGMDLSLIVSMIKTLEGKTVRITLVREDEPDYIEVDVERRHIEIPTVSHKMMENNIGYIQIMEFDTVTETQFAEALEALNKQGMEKLIIDLRNNPGGVLQVVCKMLNSMLPEGLIVYTEDKYGERKEYTSDGKNVFDKPLAILVNENSASASEIFAGAVKDYGIGKLVGTTTFGKGIVQSILRLDDGTAVKLTISKYFTPKGNDIHGVGIEPDLVVELDDKLKNQSVIEESLDNQLQAAITMLKLEQ